MLTVERLLKDTTPLQRGIIRHVMLVLDLSMAMAEKDFRPTRQLLSIRYACDYVREYFEQNPISQLGVLGMRDGLAIRVSDMSGNPNDHIEAIEKLRLDDPKGAPSLQNALEMSRAALLSELPVPLLFHRAFFLYDGMEMLRVDFGHILAMLHRMVPEKWLSCMELCSRRIPEIFIRPSTIS